jgi:FixJ family two-component response regulator
MMTAVVMVAGIEEVTNEAKAAGADDVLVKPVNVSSLIWAVDKHTTKPS